MINDYFDNFKCYQLINRLYWWFNMHQIMKRFIRNYYVCKRFKLFRQRYQDWLRSLFYFKQWWRNIFMNYIKSLSSNIFMKIVYYYVLVFIDRLFKMRHFISTIFMKVEEAVNSFYQNVWKLYNLSDALTFDRDT
jgi:hypothetical protein